MERCTQSHIQRTPPSRRVPQFYVTPGKSSTPQVDLNMKLPSGTFQPPISPICPSTPHHSSARPTVHVSNLDLLLPTLVPNHYTPHAHTSLLRMPRLAPCVAHEPHRPHPQHAIAAMPRPAPSQSASVACLKCVGVRYLTRRRRRRKELGWGNRCTKMEECAPLVQASEAWIRRGATKRAE